ncbi:MAG TPA: class I SAM-dependent methyltransferase [Hyphomicrobiaceae bacterium]|nr:class I SAM-dependent methyltransferase [Hyphomicrobiaceae bacterium]
MTGFSAQWLNLREPADQRSRNRELERALAKHFDGWRPLTIVDLGCGTGANLRAVAPLLGPEQHWTLVDHDQALLDVAAHRLRSWADGADWKDGQLALFKGAKRINVAFRRADLAGDLDAALGPNANLVTASALFDLASAVFIAGLAHAVASRQSAFYTVLSYDGDQRWTPEHAADATLLEAFHTHQRRDKGLGPAAGPDAPDALSEAFSATGYSVSEGDSAWRLGSSDATLIAELARGFAAAVAETGLVNASTVAAWSALSRSGAIVGHTDTLALPSHDGRC